MALSKITEYAFFMKSIVNTYPLQRVDDGFRKIPDIGAAHSRILLQQIDFRKMLRFESLHGNGLSDEELAIRVQAANLRSGTRITTLKTTSVYEEPEQAHRYVYIWSKAIPNSSRYLLRLRCLDINQPPPESRNRNVISEGQSCSHASCTHESDSDSNSVTEQKQALDLIFLLQRGQTNFWGARRGPTR